MSHFVIYLKTEQSVCIHHRNIKIKDIGKIYCSNPEAAKRIEEIVLHTFPNERRSRITISLMKVIEEIKSLYKEAEVSSLGENEILVYYKMPESKKKLPERLKIGAICFILFFGSGISIMGFNNDVNLVKVFSKIYLTVMGRQAPPANFMHAFYAVGLCIGMIVFFNHASRKRLSDEPTPIEVQMRMYEKNVNAALIVGSSRNEEEVDVDS
jgi:stage V sporulation protein AA